MTRIIGFFIILSLAACNNSESSTVSNHIQNDDSLNTFSNTSDTSKADEITVSQNEHISVETSSESSDILESTNEGITTEEIPTADAGLLTRGIESYRGFSVDNVYHSPNDGEIHFNLYVPESYDNSRPYALFVTLPGYEGLYFQGVAANIKSEEFGFEAQKYNPEMIIAAPQLSDWRDTSANQTIALTEFLLDIYSIDKVYANGYSGGGETLSLVLEKRTDLFTACLHVSSQWDGDLQPVANARLPIYFAIGENDEYYGSKPVKTAYDELCGIYEKQGLSSDEIAELAVLDVKSHDYFVDAGAFNEHGGGGYFAFDSEIMGWLFEH